MDTLSGEPLEGYSLVKLLFHFEINVNDNDSTDKIIPNYLSSVKCQNEWSAPSYKRVAP